MATKHVYFSGKAKWCKVLTPSKYNKYSVDLYLSKDDVDRFRELKVRNHLRKDDDGYYVTFSRPTEITRKGQKVGLAPPVVIDKDGTPVPGVHIGNNSDITIDLEHYSFKTPSGGEDYAVRLARVRIDNLVPFNPDEELAEQDVPEHLALVNQPTPIPF